MFYKDCASANTSSLTIELKYLDDGPFPQYNCVINTENRTCASLCTKLLLSYKLVLLQQANNKQVQPAWTGLSKCNRQPNVKLIYDSTINPCSSGIMLRFEYLVFVFTLLKIFL